MLLFLTNIVSSPTFLYISFPNAQRMLFENSAQRFVQSTTCKIVIDATIELSIVFNKLLMFCA